MCDSSPRRLLTWSQAKLNKLKDQHNCIRYEITNALCPQHSVMLDAMESSGGPPRSRQMPCSIFSSARFGLPRIALGMLECYGLSEPPTNRREQVTPPLPPVWHVCFVSAFDEWHFKQTVHFCHSSNLRELTTTWLPVSPRPLHMWHDRSRSLRRSPITTVGHHSL